MDSENSNVQNLPPIDSEDFVTESTGKVDEIISQDDVNLADKFDTNLTESNQTNDNSSSDVKSDNNKVEGQEKEDLEKEASAACLGSYGDMPDPIEPHNTPVGEEKPAENIVSEAKTTDDTLFGNVNPRVVELVYWKEPKKSAVVFASILGFLLAMQCCSIIAVVYNLLLGVTCLTMSYRLYTNVLQALRKEPVTNPFSAYLNMDVRFTSDQAQRVLRPVMTHFNCILLKLRSVLLVQDFVDSLKYGVFFWVMCYVGGIFNLLTLVIVGVIGVFTVPILYQMYQAPIDQGIAHASDTFRNLLETVKQKVPFLKPKNE